MTLINKGLFYSYKKYIKLKPICTLVGNILNLESNNYECNISICCKYFNRILIPYCDNMKTRLYKKYNSILI